ncbi:centrosomal protein of 44 kDa isoform X2 [Gambusia affinis]|uniref:centrosomal protein of 44 kDa isoform X2 n=1 Tax=Gambusia affinis TaxID=33528 RepID=UPI001CDC5F56|nr:centrosomal protein of 44 kDa isoform X2 [Gambusia affinis]
MLSAGNVQSCLRKLEALLRVIKYPSDVDYRGLSKGDPSSFLPIVSFTLTTFSPPFAEQLVAAGLELSGKTDLRFTDTLYKVLRDIFHYKPILTKEQFLQWGFSQRKISFICDIINLVLQRHKQLRKPKVRYPAKHNVRKKSQMTTTDADAVSKHPFVEDHRRNPLHFATSAKEDTFSADNEGSTHHSEMPPSGLSEIPTLDEEESKESFLFGSSSEVDGRLSALEANVDTLMSAFNKLDILEKRLEELEFKSENKNDEEVVMVPKESWENLMSRVVLLEAKLELRDIQLNASSPAEPLTSPHSSLSAVDSSQDLKERLKRITSMMKETSSLLKNKESCTILHLTSDGGVAS